MNILDITIFLIKKGNVDIYNQSVENIKKYSFIEKNENYYNALNEDD